MHRYALQIRKSDLPLLTFLNGGVEPEIKNNIYLVFEICDPYTVATKIVTEREFDNEYEIGNLSPLLLKLKK